MVVHVVSSMRPPQLRQHHCELASSASSFHLIASPSQTRRFHFHTFSRVSPPNNYDSHCGFPITSRSCRAYLLLSFLLPSSPFRSHRRTCAAAAAAASAAPSMQHNADGPHPRCWAAARTAQSRDRGASIRPAVFYITRLKLNLDGSAALKKQKDKKNKIKIIIYIPPLIPPPVRPHLDQVGLFWDASIPFRFLSSYQMRLQRCQMLHIRPVRTNS